MEGAATGAAAPQRLEQRLEQRITTQAGVALLQQPDAHSDGHEVAQMTQHLSPASRAADVSETDATTDAATAADAAHGRVLVPQADAQESPQVPAGLLVLRSAPGAAALDAAPCAAPEAALAGAPCAAAPKAAAAAAPQTEAPKAPQGVVPANVAAHVAKKKRRITPQSTAIPAPAVGVASTHPAPTRERAIERTPEQYLQEVRRDAETIMDTMSRFQSMTATEMLYEDGVDLQSVSVLAQRVFGNMSMFQVYFRARRCEEQDAEDERRATLKPVPIDQSETELYNEYKSKLTGGNKTLYKCPFADAGCICKAGPAAAGPGLKAIVQRHIDRVHCKSSKKRAEHHGLGEAMAEGWVV